MTPEKWARAIGVAQPPALLKTETDSARRQEVTRALMAHLPAWWHGQRVLALGCGDGYELEVMRTMGIEPVGVTFDATEAAADPAIIQADIHDLPLQDGWFRFVYSKEMMEHLVSPFAALLEMNRVMAIGGEFLHLISCGMEKQRETYHLSCFPDWLWYDLFKKAGFQVDLILDGHATEIGFLGRKVEEADPARIPRRWSYDLNGEMNGVKRQPIQL